MFITVYVYKLTLEQQAFELHGSTLDPWIRAASRWSQHAAVLRFSSGHWPTTNPSITVFPWLLPTSAPPRPLPHIPLQQPTSSGTEGHLCSPTPPPAWHNLLCHLCRQLEVSKCSSKPRLSASKTSFTLSVPDWTQPQKVLIRTGDSYSLHKPFNCATEIISLGIIKKNSFLSCSPRFSGLIPAAFF